jgi:Meiotically up-regulated gene 113
MAERPDIMPPVMPVNRFCEFSGFGRTTIYKLMESGELASELINGRRMIALDSYYDMVNAAIAAEPPREKEAEKRRSPVRMRFPGTGLIYFIATSAGHIKIGYSANPDRRLKSLQTASSVPLRLIGTLPGTLKDEEALHARFAKYRVRGEWFTLTGALRSFIERLSDV